MVSTSMDSVRFSRLARLRQRSIDLHHATLVASPGKRQTVSHARVVHAEHASTS